MLSWLKQIRVTYFGWFAMRVGQYISACKITSLRVHQNNKILRILQNAPLKSHLAYTKIIILYQYHCYMTFKFSFLSINFYTMVTKCPLYLLHISYKIHLYTITIREKNTAYIYITHTLISANV